eukprot:COSAG06_NODE_9542_length_1874_cov_26.162817_3_plen_184_part_00
MQHVRSLGWLKRAGAVDMRRAALCDGIGLGAGFAAPLMIGLALHYLSAEDANVAVQERTATTPPTDAAAAGAAGGAIAAGGAGAGGGGAVVDVQSMSEICDPNGASAMIGFALLLSIVALAAHIVERMFAPRAEVRKTVVFFCDNILYSTTDNRTFPKTGSGQIQEKLKTKRENTFLRRHFKF